MPRVKTTDRNAEKAVDQFLLKTLESKRTLADSWLTIAEMLMTCEIWAGKVRGWEFFHGQLVLRESNDYRLKVAGGSNMCLQEANLVGDYMAAKMGVPRAELCSKIGTYVKPLQMQPNNPRGHAFRSLIATTLAFFGDQELEIREEVEPHTLFPGFTFPLRSTRAKVDIAVFRNSRIVALCSARWSYRHDRVDMLEEAQVYLPAARMVNPNCRFFGITAEFSESRLLKVIRQTVPLQKHAAMERLVHLHRPLATVVIGRNSELMEMMDLTEWVADSANWL